MELGELELAVLRAVRTLGEATSGEVYEEVLQDRHVAYTSVTTTLYRLVEKDLVALRKQSEKRVFYRIKDGRAYRKAMAAMVDSVLDTFGGAAVSYLLDSSDKLAPCQVEELEVQVASRRKKESAHD
ncbi:MAG TPA: BlaI/MecI/CopY family transcriptional regulator [Thermoplasmata archaeon]|nr:BlaI/MecI/CopY family transcriptional regulator [Thermoplasmata archaeon]